ncbi:MAG: hypothetical protein V2A77_07295 [Pseudomonadota bacterium]
MFDPSSFLQLAKKLILNGDEASLRSAVSRAYYAVFLTARQRLEALGRTDSRNRGFPTHNFVWSELENQPLWSQIGQDGRRLHGARKNADYGDHVPNPAKFALQYLTLAERLLSQDLIRVK